MRASLHLLVLALAGAGSTGAWAHGGGLNADGCHVNRKTGDYHCHRGAAQASMPRQAYAGLRHDLDAAPASPQGRSRSPGAFANCAQARAAGAAPLRVGEPGYGPHLDRDNDGIACEPYRGRR